MFGATAKAVVARLMARALPRAIAVSRHFGIVVIVLKDVSIFLLLVSQELIIWAATTAAAAEFE